MAGLATQDWFPCFTYVLRLSNPLSATPDLTVEAIAEGERDFTEVTEGWFLDNTGRMPRLIFETTPATNRSFELSVRATYTSGGTAVKSKHHEQITQAVRYMVSTLFESRGGPLPENWERGLNSILRSATQVVV